MAREEVGSHQLRLGMVTDELLEEANAGSGTWTWRQPVNAAELQTDGDAEGTRFVTLKLFRMSPLSCSYRNMNSSQNHGSDIYIQVIQSLYCRN